MTIGLLTIELLLSSTFSLKDKRSILSSIKRKLQHKFNIAVAEIAYKDLWNKTSLAVVTVSDSSKVVDSILQHVFNFFEQLKEIEVLSVNRVNF